jgi:AcrR family transcriptional regulator
MAKASPPQTIQRNRRAPGRPRSERVDLAIRSAVLHLLAESGFEAVTIEAVADRAGVGKATIYRRWRSRHVMIAAVLRTLTSEIELPDTGLLRTDLIELVSDFRNVTLQSIGGAVMSRIVAAVLGDPELLAIFEANVVQPRRTMLHAVLARAQSRGALKPETDPDLAVSLIVGPILFLVLLQPASLEETTLPARIIDTLLAGIGA